MKLPNLILSKFKRKTSENFSDGELSAFTSELIKNYKKNYSLLAALELSIHVSAKYKIFSKLLNSIKLGYFPKLQSSNEYNSNTSTLLNILIIGLSNNVNIEENLINFHFELTKRIEDRNRIRSKTNGMQVISLLGVIFFFPLFSGITAGIILSSGSLAAQKPIADGIKALCMGYIALILLITNYFLNPLRSLFNALKSSVPLILIAYFFQSAAFYFASYAI